MAGVVALFTFTLLQVLHHLFAGSGSDFRAVLRGASDLAGGRDLYQPALHFLGTGNLRAILGMPVTPYVYPPPLAILMRPFTSLPPGTALVLWDAVNVSLLAVLFVLVVRLSGARSFRQLALIGAIYGFFPLNMGLGTGQIDITITMLGLLAYLFYRSERLRRAGILLGVITLIKPTVGALVLFFLCRRAWPVLVAFAGTLAVGAGVSALVVGGRVLWEYREVAAGWANAFGVLPVNQSLHGMVLRLLSPRLDFPPSGSLGHLSLVLELAFVVGAGTVSCILLRHGEPAGLRKGALQYYAVFSVLLMGIPFTESTHLSWLLPGIGLLFVLMAQQDGWRPWHAIAVASYMTLALPFSDWTSWRTGASMLQRLGSSTQSYGLLVLTAVLCYVAFMNKTRESLAEPLPLDVRRYRSTRYGTSVSTTRIRRSGAART